MHHHKKHALSGGCCVALRCVALRCVALRCVALRCVALRCVALRCCFVTELSWVDLDEFALSCVVLWCHPCLVLSCLIFGLSWDVDDSVCPHDFTPNMALNEKGMPCFTRGTEHICDESCRCWVQSNVRLMKRESPLPQREACLQRRARWRGRAVG